MKTNWQTKKLREICEKPENISWSSFPKQKFQYIDLSSVSRESLSVINSTEIDRKTAPSRAKQIIKNGDIIFGTTRPTLKRVAKIYPDFDNQICSTGFVVLRPITSLVISEYVYYFIQSDEFIERMSKIQRGANYPAVSDGDVKSQELLLPPIKEQERIVKTLDEAFEKVAKAKENAEKNSQNSKDLFKSYLQSIFENNNNDWCIKTLDDVCKIQYGYTEKAKSVGDYRFIRITDTDKNGLLTQEDKMYVDTFNGNEKYILTNGDLLMARTGASAGNLLFFESGEPSIFASYMIRLRFDKEIINKLYWYFSKSKSYWDQVNQLSAGAAQPQFNGGALKKILFPFPLALSEQKQIVKKLDSLSEQIKKLEENYKQKITDLDEFKKSLLTKAFAGEL